VYQILATTAALSLREFRGQRQPAGGVKRGI
jgi:hypothetical protein